MTVDYEVEVKPLVAPIGMNKYVARIVHCYVIEESKRTSVDPCVGETWGATRTEARAKLHDRMERWITSQRAL